MRGLRGEGGRGERREQEQEQEQEQERGRGGRRERRGGALRGTEILGRAGGGGVGGCGEGFVASGNSEVVNGSGFGSLYKSMESMFLRSLISKRASSMRRAMSRASMPRAPRAHLVLGGRADSKS